jgi:membrane-bound metal-dependent hydrolase YbcI (DUF457 family)
VLILTILSQYGTTYGTSELLFNFSDTKTSKMFNLTTTGTFTTTKMLIYIYIYIYIFNYIYTQHRCRWEDKIKIDLQEVGWGGPWT